MKVWRAFEEREREKEKREREREEREREREKREGEGVGKDVFSLVDVFESLGSVRVLDLKEGLRM